ncbi:MAG: histidine--tRNA ligase [Actinomycetota bacterium]
MAAAESFRAPSGTHDVLWPESFRWERFSERFSQAAEALGFGLIQTPTFEDLGVFKRGIGENNDVVGKEMYVFEDRGGRQMALRPEGTASVVRAFVQHRPVTPFKAWYLTPSFRYERPQAGRFREHHQVGVELIGTADADADVEVIALAENFLRSLGLSAFTTQLGTMGDAACRPAYLEKLTAYLEAKESGLCEEHQPKWRANPLRILDCKKSSCVSVADAGPMLLDHLCEDCALHHERVLEGLAEAGIAVVANPKLVRGFDYYTRTTFEFSSSALDGAQNALGGGGRYDGLVEMLGGPQNPGIGFGMGIERVLLACDAEGVFTAPAPQPEVFVIDVTDGRAARGLALELRRHGIRVERAFDARSLKSQLKQADRSGALLALIVGSREIEEGMVTLRDLRDGAQESVVASDIVAATVTALGREGQ